MDKNSIFGYLICGVVIIASWFACFLPTFFYLNPVAVPADNAGKLLRPGNNASVNPFPSPSFPCNPPLIYSNKSGYCKLPCDWLPFSDYEQNAMSATDWITAIFCITTFLVVLLTWLKIPEFVKFPHILILFMAGTGAFVELLVIIPKFGDRKAFFCSSEFFDEVVDNPTSFCQTQGSLIYYISLVTGEMFVVYNVMLFKNLVIDKLPMLSVSKKWLTVGAVAGIIFPIVPVVYMLKSSTNYVPAYLRHCFPKDSGLTFYLVLLPQQFMLTAGVTFVLMVIFKLVKERKSSLIGSARQAQTRQEKLQRVMIHFVMAILSYIVCVYLTYGVICKAMSDSKAYEHLLQQYFKCLMFSPHCPKDFERYATPSSVLILSFLAGNVFQIGTLVLLAGKPKTRHLWCSWIRKTTKRRGAATEKPPTGAGKTSAETQEEGCTSTSRI